MHCRGVPVIAVNDAWRLLPFADVLYAADNQWWEHHRGCPGFEGERWSAHSTPDNDKTDAALRYGIRLVHGSHKQGFAFNPAVVRYGPNGGYQAINLAIHMLGRFGRIILTGFDMRVVEGRRHFFGDHPPPMHRETDYRKWLPAFDSAARMLPSGIEIVNATPGSALKCFPAMELAAALQRGAGCGLKRFECRTRFTSGCCGSSPCSMLTDGSISGIGSRPSVGAPSIKCASRRS